MKLSIITINYNNASGLKKTMESVFNQTSHDFEYIIVDGDSIDGSKEVIAQYDIMSNRPVIWISEKDNGIYQAMNKGILLAKGEYIQFLNSGDILVSTDVTERMLKNIHDTSIYYGNMLKVLHDETIFYNREIPKITFFTFYRGTINHSSAYIKRSLFDKYGLYDESLKIVSDWKFYLIAIVLNDENVEYVDIDVSYFDMKGISNTNVELDKEERRFVLNELIVPKILSDYDEHWFDVEQMKRIKRYKVASMVVWFIERCLFKFEKRKTKIKKEHLYY